MSQAELGFCGAPLELRGRQERDGRMRGEKGEVGGEGRETSRVVGGHTLRAPTRGTIIGRLRRGHRARQGIMHTAPFGCIAHPPSLFNRAYMATMQLQV